MAAGADAKVHGLGKRLVAGVSEDTVAKYRVCLFPLLFGPAAPVSDVMLKAAIAPLRPVRDRAVGEETASVAREVRDVSRSH
jgi:hypothetical protein